MLGFWKKDNFNSNIKAYNPSSIMIIVCKAKLKLIIIEYTDYALTAVWA
jgi:hypothetical protein